MKPRTALTVIPAALLLAACGSSTSDTPEYTVTSDTDNTINVTVATSDGLDGVVNAVAEEYSDSPDGGYDVMIFCESNDEKLAWGRFAIGNLGAAQTGMEEGSTELRQTYDVECG